MKLPKAPWKFENGGIWSAEGFLIAAVTPDDNQGHHTRAALTKNGQHMTATPELVAACKAALWHLYEIYPTERERRQHHECAVLVAALAKANA